MPDASYPPRGLEPWDNALKPYVDTLGGAILFGDGAPEGNVLGDLGDIYRRKDGGPGTTLYAKVGGDGTVFGWAAYA